MNYLEFFVTAGQRTNTRECSCVDSRRLFQQLIDDPSTLPHEVGADVLDDAREFLASTCEHCGNSGTVTPGPMHADVQSFVMSAAVGGLVTLHRREQWERIDELLQQLAPYVDAIAAAAVEHPEAVEQLRKVMGSFVSDEQPSTVENALTPDELRALGLD